VPRAISYNTGRLKARTKKEPGLKERDDFRVAVADRSCNA